MGGRGREKPRQQRILKTCVPESETFSDNFTCFKLKADTKSFRSQSSHTHKEGGHQTETHFRANDKVLVKRRREDSALLTGLMLGCAGEYIPALVQITSEGMHHEHRLLPHTISYHTILSHDMKHHLILFHSIS